MYSHNLIFISNDFKFDKQYFDDYINDPENGIYPFKLEQSEQNMINDFQKIYPNSLVVDMYEVLAKPLIKMFIKDSVIDKSEITETNYGALSNLNYRYMPVNFFRSKILNLDNNYDLFNPDEFELFLKETYHHFKTDVYTKYVLNLEPNISSIISFYDEKYHESTFTIFKIFYTYIIQELFPNYSTPDTFWKFVYIVRDHMIPRLFDCLISMLLDYNSRYLTTVLLQYILTRFDPIYYEDPIYKVHSIKEYPQFKDWIIVNSFLDITNIKHEDLFNRCDNVMLVKATNVDKYDSIIYPKVNQPLDGFCLQLYNYYYHFNLFDVYVPYNSKGLSDNVDLDVLKKRADVFLSYINYQALTNNARIKYRGIISQDLLNDNRLSHFHVVDQLSDISKLDVNNLSYKDHKYLMLDSPTRDDITNYVENNDVAKKELYLDFNKLNIDIYNQDDVDYINHLKSYNCRISCLISDDYIQSIKHYNDLIHLINNVCVLKDSKDLNLYKVNATKYRVEVCLLLNNNDYVDYQFVVKTLLNDEIYKTIYFY